MTRADFESREATQRAVEDQVRAAPTDTHLARGRPTGLRDWPENKQTAHRTCIFEKNSAIHRAQLLFVCAQFVPSRRGKPERRRSQNTPAQGLEAAMVPFSISNSRWSLGQTFEFFFEEMAASGFL